MSNVDELLAGGDIRGARAALIDEVRANPGDPRVRMFLFQLCALTGEWDRAKSQADTLGKLDPAAKMLAVAYSQCIDAEATRAAVMAGQEPAAMLARVEWGSRFAEALRLRQSGAAGAEEAMAAAFDAAPASAGTLDDGTEFEWVADADPRFGPTIEAIIAGRYGLMPFAALESLVVHPPQDLRDTVWVPAEFALRQGVKVAGFIPVRYPGSEHAEDPAIALGQATTWIETGTGEAGLGQRLLVLSDGTERPLLAVRRIDFADE
ncbi:type VI secretion system accessory protein TagJ [Tsuneonella sp. SYSU-LHT278]|uniref:type VI secretion system accessory protein TagJ n=1 Tax=Tsuneonella sediminis TaxID=3416089 RepID=UPI003F790BA1